MEHYSLKTRDTNKQEADIACTATNTPRSTQAQLLDLHHIPGIGEELKRLAAGVEVVMLDVEEIKIELLPDTKPAPQ